MSSNAPTSSAQAVPSDARIAVVASQWNEQIVGELMSGCLSRLKTLQADASQVALFRAPGAFELPTAAKICVDSGKFDAVILLGCVIRGETAHFDLVAKEAARGIQQVAVSSGIPCIFGVLAVDTLQQALDRVGGKHGHAGVAAAEAAAQMIVFARSVRR